MGDGKGQEQAKEGGKQGQAQERRGTIITSVESPAVELQSRGGGGRKAEQEKSERGYDRRMRQGVRGEGRTEKRRRRRGRREEDNREEDTRRIRGEDRHSTCHKPPCCRAFSAEGKFSAARKARAASRYLPESRRCEA
eukprot:767487-Hanusia_phi.AAC.3